MIELTVKTLDSKNHAFSVPDDTTVKQLKERIVDSVNIPAESQRLIYCGRVLQDDKNLSEYDVNGKVIHLVQRAPPVSNGSGPDRGPSASRAGSSAGGSRRPQQWRSLFGPGASSGNAMYVGAMAFPAEIMDASGISMQQPRQCLSQSRLAVARQMLQRASVVLNRLENPPQESSDTSPDNGNGSTATGGEEAAAATTSVPIQVEIAAVIDSQGPAEGPSVEVQTEPSTEPNASTNDSDAAQSTSSGEQQSPQNDNEEEGGSNARSSRTRSLAELIEQMEDISSRFRPFLSQYRQLVQDDPTFSSQADATTHQRMFNGVSEVMHILSHAYHALSDIMCDFSQPPPRHLRCQPVLIHHSAVVQTDIPIQVSANLGAATAASTQSGTSNGSGAAGEERTSQPQPTTATAAATASQSAQSAAEEPSASATPPQPSTTPASSNTPGFASPLRITRIGSGAPGLEFFVDVAPSGSIMIDSVEAHVVTNAPSAAASAGADGNSSQNPPEFVQNLITALAGQFMGATLQQYQSQQQQQQQQAASSSSQPASSSSSPQQAAGGPAAAAAAAAAAAQNSQARGNTATHPTTATQTRSTARPHVHLSPAIHAMRANSFDPFLPCNSHHLHSQRGSRSGRRAQAQTGSSTGGTTGTAGGSGTPIPAGNGISIQLRAEPVLNVITETQLFTPPAPRAPAATREGAGTAPRQVPRAVVPPHMPPEVQAIYQAIRNPNTPSTLAQLLQNVPGYSYTPGESIFTDIFMTLAQSLSFLDMVQLGLGNSECLVRARPQLRELISTRLLNNQPLTISAITQIVDRFNNELRPYYNIFDNARLREEVDLPASINLYNHSMLPSILNTVMEEGQSTFHRTLMRKCSLYVRQLCALLLYCCLDGTSGLETILRSFVNQMTTGVPGFLQEWTVSHSVVNFRTFVSSLNVPAEDIKRFLVYRVGNPATSPQPATTPPPVPPAAEPMDVQDVEEASGEVESTPTLIREPPVADVPPTQHINQVVGWQNTLPPDWVPIITRDSQRQRRQSPQGPFSDAYLSGMPSKRRKLITSAKPQGNLSQVISESMAVALGAAGMSSGPEVDVIAARAGQDRNLRTAYREQVRTTLRHNLASNPDYTNNPDQYPNTAKYFNQQ